jgi:hypothetical protein
MLSWVQTVLINMRHFWLVLVLVVFSCRVALCGDPIAAGTPRPGIGGQEQPAQTATCPLKTLKNAPSWDDVFRDDSDNK